MNEDSPAGPRTTGGTRSASNHDRRRRAQEDSSPRSTPPNVRRTPGAVNPDGTEPDPAARRNPSPHRPVETECKGSPGGQAVRNSPPGPKTQIDSPLAAPLSASVARPAIHEPKPSRTRRSMIHLCDLCSVFSITKRKPNVKRFCRKMLGFAALRPGFERETCSQRPLAVSRTEPPTACGIGRRVGSHRLQILPVELRVKVGKSGTANLGISSARPCLG